jgi:hypothetical protein
MLVDLGNGYQGGSKKILAFGTPDWRLGVWLAVAQEADLPEAPDPGARHIRAFFLCRQSSEQPLQNH